MTFLCIFNPSILILFNNNFGLVHISLDLEKSLSCERFVQCSQFHLVMTSSSLDVPVHTYILPTF